MSVQQEQQKLQQQQLLALQQLQPFQLMQQALDALEASVAQEYKEALAACTHLVYKETPFLPFLRTDQGDYHAAARRLALYWKYRKLLFGPERWLLPMTQTGTGALSPQDIEFFRMGFLVFIKRPPPLGPVIVEDWSRLTHCPGDSLLRVFVYYCALYCADEECGFQQPGITAVHVVSSRPRPPASTNPQTWQIVNEGMPVRVNKFVVAQAYEGQGRELLLEYKAFSTAKVMEFKSKLNVNVLQGHSKQKILQLLEEQAASRQYLPRQDFGGDYDYRQFDDWMRMRLSLEDILSAAPPVANSELAASAASTIRRRTPVTTDVQGRLRLTQGRDHNAASASAMTPTLQKQSTVKPQPLTLEQRRKRQNQYFKKYSEKRNAEVNAMYLRRESLTHQNAALRRENERLQGFLRAAEQFIANMAQQQ